MDLPSVAIIRENNGLLRLRLAAAFRFKDQDGSAIRKAPRQSASDEFTAPLSLVARSRLSRRLPVQLLKATRRLPGMLS